MIETHTAERFGIFSAVFDQLLSYKQETVATVASRQLSNLFLVSSQIQKRLPLKMSRLCQLVWWLKPHKLHRLESQSFNFCPSEEVVP